MDWSGAPNHPLKFSLTADGTHNGGIDYTDGITVDIENFKTHINVKSDTELFYYCANHSGMGDGIELKLPLIRDEFYLSESTIVGDKFGTVDFDVNLNNRLQLYKTESGAYIIDLSSLDINDNSISPILLTKQTTSRGITTTSLFDFKYVPTSAVYNDEIFEIYNKNNNGQWYRDNFKKDGVYDSTDILTLSELLNSEAVYNLDFNKDNSIGDTISSILVVDEVNDNGLYKTASGSFVADISSLSIGDSTSEPLIFINQLSGGRSSLYNFKSNPTGFLSFKDVLVLLH